MTRRAAALSVSAVFAVVGFASVRAAHGETAKLLKGGKWRDEPVTSLGDLKGFAPADGVRLNRYGGWAGRKAKATGFFRTERAAGRWWLIDPEGCFFISVGLCSVNHSAVDQTKLQARFGDEAGWADRTGKLLRGSGFNTLGCWSDWRSFRPTPQRMPYTPRWNFMATYKNRREKSSGERGFPELCMPVFDPQFGKFCDAHARRLASTRDDAWLLGHFSDNELPFRPDALTNYLKLPKTDAGHQAARKWWNNRRGQREQITRADQEAFLEHLARRYYSTVAAAIKKYDPNHLYLGSRVHGRTIRPAVFRGAKGFVDVMSVNYYHRWSAEQERLNGWVASSGVPFIISEWYAQSLARPDTPATGAGFRVSTDTDRGLFYQNLTLGLLRNRGCVGWHWFKYGGDGEGFHKGIVSRAYEPHTDLLKLMAELNGQVYPLAEHFMRGK